MNNSGTFKDWKILNCIWQLYSAKPHFSDYYVTKI